MKNILKILLSTVFCLEINANTVNVTEGVYESVPSCNTGFYYNKTKGVCDSSPNCTSGTLNSTGSACITPVVSAGTDIYTIKEEKIGNCNTPDQYTYKPSITETLYADKEKNYTYTIPGTEVVTTNLYGEVVYDDKIAKVYYNTGHTNINTGTVIDYKNKITQTSINGITVSGTSWSDSVYHFVGSGNQLFTYYWQRGPSWGDGSSLIFDYNPTTNYISITGRMWENAIMDTSTNGTNTVTIRNGVGVTGSLTFNVINGNISITGSGSTNYVTLNTNGSNCILLPNGPICFNLNQVTTTTCTEGYSDNGSNCKKTINYNYYNYTCDAGYSPSNVGITSYTKSDTDLASNNESTLNQPVNSSVPPTNNCIKNTMECPVGYSEVTGQIKECAKTNMICAPGYAELNGTCQKNAPVCQSGTLLDGELCKKITLGCPTDYIEVTGEEKACKKTKTSCPFSYELMSTDKTKCQKTIINFECKTKYTCEKSVIACEPGSVSAKFYIDNNGIKQICNENTPSSLCEGNEICISLKTPYCDLGYTYSAASNKCEAPAICEEGYILQKDGCKRDYTYTIYTCGVGFEGPVDQGFDCLASCGGNKCSCNPETPPANNCKKRFSLGNDPVVIKKQRDIMEHKATGTVAQKEYGITKNYPCGENCLTTITEIIGKDDKLCFKKESGNEECIQVEGCGFEGKIKNNKTPNDIFDLNVDNQYMLSLTKTNLSPEISNIFTCSEGTLISSTKYCQADSGPACPAGYTFNKDLGNKCILSGYSIIERTNNTKGAPLKATDHWGGFHLGISDEGCNNASVSNVNVTYNNSGTDGISVYSAMQADSQESIGLTGTSTMGTSYIGYYHNNRDTAQFKIDFNTGLVYNGHCKNNYVFSPVAILDGFGINNNCKENETVSIDGRCLLYTNPQCKDGYIWDSVSRNCYKNIPAEDSFIKSTCKMNGHVGWHSRTEGIVSIIPDPINKGKIKFWDSFLDKDLGFIEFVKDVKEEDRKEGFIAENKFLYEMLGANFTAIDVIENSTFFVSSFEKTENECIALAAEKGLNKATITDGVKESLKKLSGNRYELILKEPKCIDSIYSYGAKACISSETNSSCLNGKLDIVNGNYVWDNSQGDSITLYQSILITKANSYKINISTLGAATVFIDGYIVSMQSVNNNPTSITDFYLTEGIHEIKIEATKNIISAINGSILSYGNRGFQVSVIDNKGISILNSTEWCKTKQESVCPTEGFVKLGKLCLQKKVAFCETGKFDINTGLCELPPKCVLVKNTQETFAEQTKVIKEETRPGQEMAYKCSPLICSNNSCQTASCITDTSGSYTGNIIDPKGTPLVSGECTDQVCDANKDYYEYCGRRSGCDPLNPLIFEENGVCKEMFCATGFTIDMNTKKCKRLECPVGTTANQDGSCTRN